MSDTFKQPQDNPLPAQGERRMQSDLVSHGLAERRRFGKGFAPVDVARLGTEEAMQAYLAMVQERRSDNPQS